jgi:hypothetical protein
MRPNLLLRCKGKKEEMKEENLTDVHRASEILKSYSEARDKKIFVKRFLVDERRKCKYLSKVPTMWQP